MTGMICPANLNYCSCIQLWTPGRRREQALRSEQQSHPSKLWEQTSLVPRPNRLKTHLVSHSLLLPAVLLDPPPLEAISLNHRSTSTPRMRPVPPLCPNPLSISLLLHKLRHLHKLTLVFNSMLLQEWTICNNRLRLSPTCFLPRVLVPHVYLRKQDVEKHRNNSLAIIIICDSDLYNYYTFYSYVCLFLEATCNFTVFNFHVLGWLLFVGVI